jgi:hypothetical protein
MMISPSANEVTAAVLNISIPMQELQKSAPRSKQRAVSLSRTVPTRPILFHSPFSKTLHESRGNR